MPTFDLRGCGIVPPTDPIPSERRAVEELSIWIERITGRTPQVRDHAGEGSLVLGHEPSLGSESFTISVENGSLTIDGGRPRGVIYGVYELLDRFAGIRWVSADETIIP
jgi:hypothetical protein